MDVEGTGRNGVKWIQLALYRGNYRAVLNAVMTLPSPTQCGIFRDKRWRIGSDVSKERVAFILKGQVDQEENYYLVK